MNIFKRAKDKADNLTSSLNVKLLSDLSTEVERLKSSIEKIEYRLKQLECPHENIRTSYEIRGIAPSPYRKYCLDCGKIFEETWDYKTYLQWNIDLGKRTKERLNEELVKFHEKLIELNEDDM